MISREVKKQNEKKPANASLAKQEDKKEGYRGMALVNVIVFAAIAITITIGLVNWGSQIFRTVKTLQAREQAFQIAEAGIEYYRWHLAHFPTDYKDGTTTPSPYIHTFQDSSGTIIGQFSLTITPPKVGSTLVTIKSTGTVSANPGISRTLQSTLAIPSFAKYAFAANDFMRFGSGTVVNGPIHSNNGIRFDGLANNIVTSAKTTFTDPDTGLNEWGVYTTVSPQDAQPNTPLVNRSDVFVAGRAISQPVIDFSGITANFNQLQTLGQSAGGAYLSPSGSQGYHITFSYSAGTTTYSVKKVTSIKSAPSGCTSYGQTNWGTWSINNESNVSSGNHVPGNGVIFVADNVWVDGTIGNARITVAAGKLPQPATPPDIIVNSDLRYTNYDGSDVLGLISQGNVTVGLLSDDNLNIDGALVAQNGRVGRFYYDTDCTSSGTAYWHRNNITLYGMIATNIRYGFTYTGSAYNCGGSIGQIGSGYCNRDITYDPNLLYGPPPSFPLSSSQYQTLSWQEIY